MVVGGSAAMVCQVQRQSGSEREECVCVTVNRRKKKKDIPTRNLLQAFILPLPLCLPMHLQKITVSLSSV